MRLSAWYSLIFLLTCSPVAVLAADTAGAKDLLARKEGAYAVPGSQTFTVNSAHGRSYRIFVWVPDEPAPTSGFPVLVTLDGNAYFAAAVSALQVMAPANPALKMQSSPIRPMIVVGVGYPGDEPFALSERAFDYLPELTAVNTDLPRQGWPGRPPGGADPFITFLVEELRPALAARYPIDAGHQSLMGHSLGGFFTLYALMKRPSAFRNYIAVSPSLWWDEHSLVTEAGAKPLDRAVPTPRHVLVAVAKDELPDSPERSRMMRDLGQTMVTNLNRMGKDRIDARYVELPIEDHQSMQIAILPAALRSASQ